MPVTRTASRILQERRHRSVPYQIPTEILGEVYRHVDRPAAFGAVNSVFRGVRKDNFFEKNRVRRIIQEEIQKNKGSKIFGRIPDSLSATPTPELMGMFFDEGCVVMSELENVSEMELSNFTLMTGKGIEQIVFKAIVGINSFSAAVRYQRRFLPVGRLTLATLTGPENNNLWDLWGGDVDSGDDDIRNQLTEWYTEKLVQNSSVLKPDLIRVIRADLQDPPASWDWREIFAEKLQTLSGLDVEGTTAMDVIEDLFVTDGTRFGVRKENVKIVGGILEVTLCCALNYRLYDAIDYINTRSPSLSP